MNTRGVLTYRLKRVLREQGMTDQQVSDILEGMKGRQAKQRIIKLKRSTIKRALHELEQYRVCALYLGKESRKVMVVGHQYVKLTNRFNFQNPDILKKSMHRRGVTPAPVSQVPKEAVPS